MWDALGILLVGFAGADLTTTEYALTQPGFYEMNPLMQDRWVRVGAKATMTTLVYWHTEKLRKTNPKLALAYRVAVVALWGYAMCANLRTLNR